MIKVLMVDDHAILRDGVRALLGLYGDIEIVGEASDGEESIKKARDLAPDVILMDLAMPGIDGLEAARQITKESPKAKVLALTQYEDRQHVLSAIQAGVCGYVTKRAISSELVTAIRAIYKGDHFLQPSITRALIEGYIRQSQVDPYDRLAPREREILKLAAEGHTSRKISDSLNIKLKTVQDYRAKVAKKLGLRNSAELIKYAIRRGLTRVDS